MAGLASFIVPGLGQLVQGRVVAAIVFFVLSGALWVVLLGWLGHVAAALEAAVWQDKSGRPLP